MTRRSEFGSMEISIAVVDDRRIDSEKIQRAIHKWFSENSNHTLKNITCFTNGESILKDFMPGKFQIVFMDIIMNDINGIETSKKLRERDTQLIIIFMTTSSEYAFDAFTLHPFDYIMKPFDTERMNHVLSDAVRFIETPEPYITVRVSRSRYDIMIRDISSVLANDHTVELVMTDGNCLLCSMSFHEFKDMLMSDSRFLECNRGVIINMDCVLSLSKDKNMITMNDGSVYPIRVKERAKIIEKFNQYQFSRIRNI